MEKRKLVPKVFEDEMMKLIRYNIADDANAAADNDWGSIGAHQPNP